MRFDASVLCGIMAAKMTFRPLISDIRLAGLVGLCLAAVCISRAGDEQGRPIEVVPAHNALINTNVNGSSPELSRDFEKLLHGTTRPFNPLDDAQEGRPAPYKPPQARPLTPREQELLDRRKDWVFMTPEELMSDTDADELLGLKDYEKNGDEKKPAGSALERYYQHLLESDHPTLTATNKFRDWVSDSSENDTNSIVGIDQNQSDDPQRPYDPQRPFDNPFNSHSDPGIFQPHRENSFVDTFNLNPDNTTPSEDALRAQKEQDAQIDAFKQIWNIDQPAPSPVASSSAPISMAPAADPFASVQPVFGAAAPSLNTPTPQQSSAPSQGPLSSQQRVNNMLARPPQFVNPHGPADAN